MKFWLSVIVSVIIAHTGWSQITITNADMPVWGDTLRYTNASPIGTPVSAADSGGNMIWIYNLLTGTSQGLDEYRKPAEISPLYALTLHSTCYGYKIADSIPGIGLLAPGITINNLYTFFNKYVTPQAYVAEAFGAQISGFPVGSNYIVPDAWYIFPLNYDDNDSTDFYLKFGLATVATLKEKGYRKSRVDGWGQIITPYFTTPTNCIRIRSEIHEIDSVSLDTAGTFGLPRVTVEYKYLVNGEHYPAVWVTANVIAGFELITSVKYKDVYRAELNPTTAVANAAPVKTEVTVYPNPAADGKVTLSVPDSWKTFYVELFDMQSRPVATFKNTTALNIQSLPPGNYVARVVSGLNIAFVKITR